MNQQNWLVECRESDSIYRADIHVQEYLGYKQIKLIKCDMLIDMS